MATDATGEPDDDLATAIGEYALGEISLGRAAERAGLTRWEFEELLEEIGFTALYGPRTPEQLDEEIDTALDRD
jgi:predicted HTH domain antitoxin